MHVCSSTQAAIQGLSMSLAYSASTASHEGAVSQTPVLRDSARNLVRGSKGTAAARQKTHATLKSNRRSSIWLPMMQKSHFFALTEAHKRFSQNDKWQSRQSNRSAFQISTLRHFFAGQASDPSFFSFPPTYEKTPRRHSFQGKLCKTTQQPLGCACDTVHHSSCRT